MLNNLNSAQDWVESPFEGGPRAFLLEVTNEVMLPDYRPGEIIQVEPDLKPRMGDDVIAVTASGRMLFRRIIEAEGIKYLQATNPAWPDRISRLDDSISIYGVIIGSWMRRRR